MHWTWKIPYSNIFLVQIMNIYTTYTIRLARDDDHDYTIPRMQPMNQILNSFAQKRKNLCNKNFEQRPTFFERVSFAKKSKFW